VFAQDRVDFGLQVPLSYEDSLRMLETWSENRCCRLHVVGKSLGGRQLHRLEITDPDSPYPRRLRWGHYFANQHPGEHNSQWRMVGMIDWLLSDAGADLRRRSICHFILMMSPAAPPPGIGDETDGSSTRQDLRGRFGDGVAWEPIQEIPGKNGDWARKPIPPTVTADGDAKTSGRLLLAEWFSSVR
jgi:hypothetical protein